MIDKIKLKQQAQQQFGQYCKLVNELLEQLFQFLSMLSDTSTNVKFHFEVI